MNVEALESLAAGWREEAAMLKRRGLEQRLREWLDELLTLEGAAGKVGTKGKRGCTGRRDR